MAATEAASRPPMSSERTNSARPCGLYGLKKNQIMPKLPFRFSIRISRGGGTARVFLLMAAGKAKLPVDFRGALPESGQLDGPRGRLASRPFPSARPDELRHEAAAGLLAGV